MFRWFEKLRRGKNGHGGERELTGADIAAEFLARAGTEDRAKRLPAWALLLRSPYDTSRRVSSWLGDAPQAPRDFDWPNDTDGTPLHFLAQIDLASLKPEPETGARPPGLPEDGALLVFVGRSYACCVLNAHDMKRAVPLALPDRLESIRKHGFFSEERTFTRWPVDPVAYLDTAVETGDGRPAFLPDKFKRPADWITNGGIAALEADIVIDSLKIELSQGEQFEESRQKLGSKFPDGDVIRSKTQHYALMRRRAPAVIAALGAWRDAALAKSPEAGVDAVRLGHIMRLRLALRDEMVESYWPKWVLPGNAGKVWEAIGRNVPQLRHGGDYAALPAAYRPFAEAWITDWRRHRLFGHEPPFPNNGEDLRGQDCLISIAADPLLCTQSEHEYGMSIWCPRDCMARGHYGKGQFIRHCAV
jgi:hypothetical protein